ncbi:dentin sialophosphoprotein-like [Siniperca chuatsi]|uniref:dentin sialophosphoprotein-like n=1 Tax=Siniperca chuatsi TaxID=119488 RepID=UPI001CE0CBDD|nr:dentin sialophosphoprotein-like [Siniperca chuatsi]
MLQPALSCLLLGLISSAPLSSDGDSWSASSSDEDLQGNLLPVVGVASPKTPPTVPEAPPSVIVAVEDAKTNITLSFAIFVLAEEEEEGSGTDGRGRSDDSSESDDISSEEPMASLLPTQTETSSQPMKKEYDDHMTIADEENLSSEEMISDQPMLTFSDEEADDFNNTFNGNNGNRKRTLSGDFDDFSNSTESREVYSQPAVTVADYFDDNNNTGSDDFPNNTNSQETADPTAPLSDDYDDFNNSTQINSSDDFSNSLSSEVTELNQNLQGITLNPDNQSPSSSQQDQLVLDPVQEVTSSSSEKTSSVNQDISKGFRLGSRLQEAFRSIQEVVDLLSGNQGVMGGKGSHLGSAPNSLTGSQMGFSLSSDESNESSESVSFSNVGSDPKNQTGVSPGPKSDESLESTSYSIQQGTGSRGSTQQVTGPTTRSTDLISPDPDSKDVQDTSGTPIQVHTGGSLNPVSPDQDVTSMILSSQKDTVSKGRARSFSQVNVSLNSDSSEESQESVYLQQVVGLMTSSPGLSRVSSPEVSSSSEEVLLALASSTSPVLVSSPVPFNQTPAESGSFSSESEKSDSSDSRSKSDSPGLDSRNDSQSTEPNPNPIPISDSNLSPESNYNPSVGLNFSSEISQGESEESPTIRVPTDANSDAIRGANPTVDYTTNTASIAASSEASMDTKLDSSVKDAEASLSLEATTDSSNDVSIEADPTTATLYSTSLSSMHVISGASADANADAGSEVSVEEEDAGTEATAESVVSMKPTATTEYRTNPPDSGASTDAIANVEREQAGSDVSTEANPDANSSGPNQYASSEENTASPLPPPPPPRRKRPYRFGFLGPISHSYGNQPVARETVSKERVASSNGHIRETLAARHRQNETPQTFHHKQNVSSKPLCAFFNSRHSGRKQMRVSVAAANPAQSSSEENN